MKDKILLTEIYYKLVSFEAKLELISKMIDETRIESRKLRGDYIEDKIFNEEQ